VLLLIVAAVAFVVLQAESDVESFSTADTSHISGSSARIKKKTVDSDVTNVLTGAARSLNKLVSGVTTQRQRAEPASNSETQNDDWYFAMRMYHKLRGIPDSRDKEMFKVRMDTELINMAYGSPAVHSQDPLALQPTYYNLNPRFPQQSIGGRSAFQVPFTSPTEAVTRGQVQAGGYLSQMVALLNPPEQLPCNDYDAN